MDRSDIRKCAEDIVRLATEAADAYQAAEDKSDVPLVTRREDQAAKRVRTFLIAMMGLPQDRMDGSRNQLEQILRCDPARLLNGADRVVRAAIARLELSRSSDEPSLRKAHPSSMRLSAGLAVDTYRL